MWQNSHERFPTTKKKERKVLLTSIETVVRNVGAELIQWKDRIGVRSKGCLNGTHSYKRRGETRVQSDGNALPVENDHKRSAPPELRRKIALENVNSKCDSV